MMGLLRMMIIHQSITATIAITPFHPPLALATPAYTCDRRERGYQSIDQLSNLKWI